MTMPSAEATVIERIAGKIIKPELATDSRPGTAAILKRAPKDKEYEFFIYLKKNTTIESVSLGIKHGGGGARLFASADIAAWKEIPVKAAPQKGGVKLSAGRPFTARYLRVKLPAGKTTRLLLYDIAITETPEADNQIFDIKTANLTETGAEITYRTTLPAKTQIRLSAGRPVFDRIFGIEDQTTDHKLDFNNLTSGTDYFFQVILKNGKAGNAKTSEVTVFRTAGDPAPAITLIDMPAPGPDSAHLTLKANTPVEWRVRYGLYTADMSTEQALYGSEGKEVSGPSPTEEAAFDLTGLAPRTRYYLAVRATARSGREATSDLLGFDTAPLNLALGKPVTGTFTNELGDEYIQKTAEPMKRVTDGDENYHTGFAKAHPTPEGPQWVRVDLGAAEPVAEAVIVWSALASPEDYILSTSDDGDTWDPLLKFEGGKIAGAADAEIQNKNSERGDPLIAVTAPVNKTIRFLKLEIPKDTPVASQFGWKTPILAEIKALAPPPGGTK